MTDRNEEKMNSDAHAAGWRQTRGTSGQMIWWNPDQPSVTHDDVGSIFADPGDVGGQENLRIFRVGMRPPVMIMDAVPAEHLDLELHGKADLLEDLLRDDVDESEPEELPSP